MRGAWLTVLVVGLSVGPSWVPEMCLGAQLAVVHAQERKLPENEWCQRPEVPMPKGAHACSCHKADCADGDPNHLPAHTDPQCQSFCTVASCSCVFQDCP